MTTETGQISDGYHTFDELYDHRITLFLALGNTLASMWNILCNDSDVLNPFWRSRLHSDGSEMVGWFVCGLYYEAGKQITYHIPLSRWDEADQARTLDLAPDWDGHTSADVLKRLKAL